MIGRGNLGMSSRPGEDSDEVGVPTMDVLEHLSLDAFGVMEGFNSGAAMRLQAQHSSGRSSGGGRGGEPR